MHQGVIGRVNQHERHVNLQQENKAEINDHFPFLDHPPRVKAQIQPTDVPLTQREGRHCSVCRASGLRLPVFPGGGMNPSGNPRAPWQVCAGAKVPVSEVPHVL